MINWLYATIAGLIVLLLLALLIPLGGLRWWRRRGALVQFALMIVVPILFIAAGVVASTLLEISFDDTAGVLVGAGLGSLLPLVATSYLIEQIRVAFSSAPEDEPPHGQ